MGKSPVESWEETRLGEAFQKSLEQTEGSACVSGLIVGGLGASMEQRAI